MSLPIGSFTAAACECVVFELWAPAARLACSSSALLLPTACQSVVGELKEWLLANWDQDETRAFTIDLAAWMVFGRSYLEQQEHSPAEIEASSAAELELLTEVGKDLLLHSAHNGLFQLAGEIQDRARTCSCIAHRVACFSWQVRYRTVLVEGVCVYDVASGYLSDLFLGQGLSVLSLGQGLSDLFLDTQAYVSFDSQHRFPWYHQQMASFRLRPQQHSPIVLVN